MEGKRRWGVNMSSTGDKNMNPISVRILLPTFQGEFPRTGAMCTSERVKSEGEREKEKGDCHSETTTML